MDNDLKRAAEEFMAGKDGQRLSARSDELRRIAGSRDGERVKAMLDRDGFEDAVRRGDTEAVKRAVSGALGTEQGARLMESLRRLMGR